MLYIPVYLKSRMVGLQEGTTMTSWCRACLLLIGLIAAGAFTSQPAVAQVSRAEGEKWGDECIRTAKPGSSGPGPSLTAMKRCCDEQAKQSNQACKDEPTAPVCVNTANICKEMVTCDWTLDQCKIKIMETDKDCSTPECAKCTSDYKICHDSAVR